MKILEKIIIVILVFALIATICLGIFFSDKKSTKMRSLLIPKEDVIKSISFESEKLGNFEYSKEEEIQNILDIIKKYTGITARESIDDVPVKKEELISINFNLKNGTSTSIFAYKEKGYYIEQPYNGIYIINEAKYDRIKKFLSKDEFDVFYNNPVTKGYIDIRLVSDYYTKEQAQKDNCFVIGAMVHNDALYYDFMEKVKNKENAFIRVVTANKNKDVIITDILYDNNNILVIVDDTRNTELEEKERLIKLRKYDGISEYTYKEHLYWVAYREKLSDENFNSDKVYVITLIN